MWSIDAAYGVHDGYKGHTGGSSTMVKGYLYTISCKQKTKRKSFTEDKLVAVDDSIAHILRIRFFLLEQGHNTAEIITIL